ncbi:hypothetical protein SAG0198_00540 [Streptococcus agalactiae str. Gottschalk 1005B]|nr:hypothetical protein SAG0198_00540 [Streptococcus agalactiae str. Gottschalk 1005B]
MAILVYFLQEDTPESIGLPPIEEYHKEQYTNVVDSSNILEEPEVLGMGEIIKKYIRLPAKQNMVQ